MTATQSPDGGSTATQPATGPATPAIAFLGTGRMGGPMAANLARAGFRVRAWNRTASRAAALAEDGAAVAGRPADAVRGAGILITMLADGPATEAVLTGPEGLLAATGPGLIWVQMSTVGLEHELPPAAVVKHLGQQFPVGEFAVPGAGGLDLRGEVAAHPGQGVRIEPGGVGVEQPAHRALLVIEPVGQQPSHADGLARGHLP
jgi:3-hydroxyisobutyrate dehydrogenase